MQITSYIVWELSFTLDMGVNSCLVGGVKMLACYSLPFLASNVFLSSGIRRRVNSSMHTQVSKKFGSVFLIGPKSELKSFLLYFVDRASRYKFLVITNLTHFFVYLFISYLYMFRASRRSSSGDRIVLINHLVWLVCVSDCLVCQFWPAYQARNM